MVFSFILENIFSVCVSFLVDCGQFHALKWEVKDNKGDDSTQNV